MEILAASHVHSDWSYDGSYSLEKLRAKFSRQGCRVLLMTEHDRGFTALRYQQYRDACNQESNREILVMPGMEYSDAANRIHVLAWGVPFLGEALPTNEVLGAIRAANGLAVLAHPSRREAWKYFDAQWSSQLFGIEVWNRKYDGWGPSKTAPELLQKAGAVPFVGMDFHTNRQSFPLAMALDMDGEITEEAVLQCLRSRRCSPCAFGHPLYGDLIRQALPVLRVAERSRRTLVSIVRKSRALTR